MASLPAAGTYLDVCVAMKDRAQYPWESVRTVKITSITIDVGITAEYI